ncbi:MAG TPA: response regulator [Herpetosiphonaceae bacterium]|nr:response regulator [Herpetosiphonaceae bacterium]
MNGIVLVVDAETSLQKLFRAMLQEPGYRVDCVGTTAAIVALLAQRYDGVLLDYQLPGEDGLSFALRAAPALNLPPVLIVTGQDLWPLRQRVLPACVNAILAKPLELQTLAALAGQRFAP